MSSVALRPMIMKVYRFKDWQKIYESNRSREVENLSYYCQPNKLTGECLGLMMQQADGLELYGTLGFLKALASTAYPKKYRGSLYRNGSPMDAARMSALLRIPQAKIERALVFFSTAPMDWLEWVDWHPTGTPSAEESRSNGTAGAGHATGIPSALGGQRAAKKERKKEGRKTESEEREREKTAALSVNGAAQTKQFASARARQRELESVDEGERTDEEWAELKKMRGLVRAIQKKQRAGNFTPVTEDEL